MLVITFVEMLAVTASEIVVIIICRNASNYKFPNMDVWMYVWMDVWMHGWMNEWMDVWMGGWMDG